MTTNRTRRCGGASGFDEDEHDDDGGPDEEYEHDRHKDGEMAAGRPPGPSWRRGGHDGDGQRPQGRTGRTNGDVFKAVAAGDDERAAGGEMRARSDVGGGAEQLTTES